MASGHVVGKPDAACGGFVGPVVVRLVAAVAGRGQGCSCCSRGMRAMQGGMRAGQRESRVVVIERRRSSRIVVLWQVSQVVGKPAET